jgi:hypothetical protein
MGQSLDSLACPPSHTAAVLASATARVGKYYYGELAQG